MQRYPMNDTLNVAEQASREVTEYLLSLEETLRVENVEEIAAYQAIDVDLLWFSRNGRIVQIEVKGDRYHQTGNYFFETVSNKQRGTPGCFLYTEADYVFYYFVDVGELHVLPMPDVRNWFFACMKEFPERETSTPTRGGESYITVGRLVPRSQVQQRFPGMNVRKLRNEENLE